MMQRTTIMLPNSLRIKASQLAHHLGVSMGELIRESLLEKLAGSKRHEAKIDPFFADDQFFTGKIPTDIAVHHDQYLYGDDE